MTIAKKIAGVDVLLKVAEANGNITVLGGQTNCTLNRGAETIDISDKTTGGYKSSMPGLLSWSVDCDGFVILGDNSYELIEDAFMNRQPLSVEIRIGATNDSEGVTYTGSGYIVDLPLEFSKDDAVTYALTIEGASALTRVKGVAVEDSSGGTDAGTGDSGNTEVGTGDTGGTETGSGENGENEDLPEGE